MTMNILAVLISLAMMLTGVGGEGMPAEAARTLVVSNVSLTYNGETVNLAPSLRLGAATDGEKAVYDIGVDLNGETLFPIQLGADESGLTLLAKSNGTAVKVSAEALDALTEQANQMMESMQGQMMAGSENPELMTFITQEFIPAYAGLIEAVKDPAFAAELQAKGDEIFNQVIDRGEGTPIDAEIDGTAYALTEYQYTIDSDQMAALCDAIYTSEARLEAFYNALFKLYSLMPEESGLNDLTSFSDVFGKFGVSMTLDVVEQVSDDQTVDRMDGTLTMDMSGMIQNVVTAQGQTAEVPELAPIVMNISSSKVGDVTDVTVSCNYDLEANGESMAMDIFMTGQTEGMQNVNMEMSMSMAQNGNDLVDLHFNVVNQVDEETGAGIHSLNYGVTANNLFISMQDVGASNADGTSQDSVVIASNTNGTNMSVSFDVEVTADDIEDLANGSEADVTIDDLSQEAMANLGEDQSVQAALMQFSGAIMGDAQKLTADESVQQLLGLFAAIQTPVEQTYTYEDDSFEGEETSDIDQIEDDGVLAFNQPEITWMPEGWELENSEVDTAYDWVSLSYSNGENGFCYVNMYQDASNPVNYVVDADGNIEAIEDREITVNDYGDGDISIGLVENNVYCSMSFYGGELDMETIGKIVAGIQF